MLRESELTPFAGLSVDIDIAEEVLIPALKRAEHFRGMFGYFTSGALAELAPGLASFIHNGNNAPMRFIISPAITEDDRAAIEASDEDSMKILEKRLKELLANPDLIEHALEHHATECLAWLLAEGRLEIRVAYSRMRYHPKVWLLSDKSGMVCVRGSMNFTRAAVGGNIENIDVDLSWLESGPRRIQPFERSFEQAWADQSAHMKTYSLSEALKNDWIERYSPDEAPSEAAYREAYGRTGEGHPKPYVQPEFSIPSNLAWHSGTYAHQGEAVAAFEANGRRGILEMATGAGKTITALICAARAYAEAQSMILIIAVPTNPLIDQWTDEVAKFGLEALIPSHQGSPQRKMDSVNRAIRDVTMGRATIRCLLVTYHLLGDPEFAARIKDSSIPKFLVADEVHNAGTARVLSSLPEEIDYRLGLSATASRKYDEEGTTKLFAYFGGPVYEFGLDRAVGFCLSEYDYYVHVVSLTPDESMRWAELSEKIRANAWRAEAGEDEYLAQLYRERRKVLEIAEGKLPALAKLISMRDPDTIRHTLIYASSKNPQQLKEVRKILRQSNIRFQQVTQQESGNSEEMTGILNAFREGVLQVLVAKKVLDEGVNVPEIREAFILASQTTEREWTQRRGRILRIAPGKTHAVLHDFVALPAREDLSDEDARAMIRGELERIQEFAKFSRNRGAPDGGLVAATHIVERYCF